jgi:hypothetical protein
VSPVKHGIALGLLGFWLFAAVPGCTDEVARTVDCGEVCSRYSDCIKEIDVTACTAECEDQADADASYESRASTCEDCLDGKTCMEAESCWATCPVEASAR